MFSFKNSLVVFAFISFIIAALVLVTKININSSKDKQLADIIEVGGDVFMRSPKQNYRKVETSQKLYKGLYNNQRFYGNAKSYIKIKFKNGTNLIISDEFEILLMKVKTKIFIYLLYGKIQSYDYKSSDEVFVIYKNQTFTANKSGLEKINSFLSPIYYKHSNSSKNYLRESQAKKKDRRLRKNTSGGGLKGTHYTLHIDKVIAKAEDSLENCQIQAIKEATGAAKGHLIVSFQILNSGKVKSAQIVSSNLVNSKIESCVLRTFKRLQFRPFNGENIFFSYPIEFH